MYIFSGNILYIIYRTYQEVYCEFILNSPYRRWCSNMSEAKIVYTSNEVYRRLWVSGSTFRKYLDVLEREGIM